MTFDRHEVVFAEGAPSESLHLGSMTMSALDRAAQDEVLTIFPELDQSGPPQLAHGCLRHWEGQILRSRFQSSGKVIKRRSPAA